MLPHVTHEAFEGLVDDVKWLWCHNNKPVDVLASPPSAFVFLRDYVSLSRPCIIQKALVEESPATGKASKECYDENSQEGARSLSLTLDELAQVHPDLILTVNLTPDGHGDCLRYVGGGPSTGNEDNDTMAPPLPPTRVFVQPAQRTLSVTEFRRRLRRPLHPTGRNTTMGMVSNRIFEQAPTVPTHIPQSKDDTVDHNDDDEEEEDAVYYYSLQNDCIRTELLPYWKSQSTSSSKTQWPESIPWASEAFGAARPEAMNLWMGPAQAASAMHCDPYENLYYVASGEKVFDLRPPAHVPFLYQQPFASGHFVRCGNKKDDSNITKQQITDDDDGKRLWKVAVHPTETVHWIAVDQSPKESSLPWYNGDTNNNTNESFPLYSSYLQTVPPLTVTVRAGEMLYIPALWFHAVSQTRETVAINYWYSMRMESPLYCSFHFLQQLRPPAPTVSNDDDTKNRTEDQRKNDSVQHGPGSSP